MTLWYAVYDDTSKDVLEAGFYADSATVEANLPAGKSITVGFQGEIPVDLFDMDTKATNYTYNTSTEQLELKA